ncbi:MAG: hypothetical protein ACRD4E_07600 [Bryobacteraceae bacterium]
MPLIAALVLIILVVGFRVWAAADAGLAAAYFKRLGARTAIKLCTASILAAVVVIYLSSR